MAKPVSLSAAEIVELLAEKHSDDVFVPECKSGPTQFGGHDRIDAWVMPKSWAHPDVIGYEVKVDRADFMRDQKWPRYLDLCNLLYFVAPRGVIFPSELPAEVGLMEVSTGGRRIITKRRAARRDVTIPEDVFRYVLMCRAVITRERSTPVDRSEFWQQWLRKREDDRRLGHEVGGRIAKLYAENVERVDRELSQLRLEIEGLKDTRQILAELGVDSLPRWRREQTIRDAVRAHRSGLLAELLESLPRARKTIDQLLALAANAIDVDTAKAERVEL